MIENKDISIQQIIDALLDFDTPFPTKHLYYFSDIDTSDLNQLISIWRDLPVWRRRGLVEDLSELSSRDTVLSFKDVCLFAVEDEEPEVRLSAVEALGIYEEASLSNLFLNLLRDDQEVEIKAAAAGELGQYVYLGEIESIDNSILHEIEDGLLEALRKDYPDVVGQRALEALGFSSRKEVSLLIEDAYQSGKNEWISSALLAMGRSADEKWHSNILEMLDHKIPSIRCEAARAAGELEIKDAADQLFDLIDDPDEDTRLASIWSLTQIGGEGVSELIEDLLDEADTEQDIEFLEAAAENLAFNESVQLFPLFDLPNNHLEDQENGLDDIEDVEF
jgi:hypothetical protein